MNENNKLEKLKSVLELLQNDTVTPQKLAQFVTTLVKIVKDSKESMESTSQETKDYLNKAISYLDSEHSKLIEKVNTETSKIDTKLTKKLEKSIFDMKVMCEDLMMYKPIDGKDGIDGIDGKDGKDGSPDTAKEIKDKLETLKGEERLDSSAIKGLDTLEKGITNRAIEILDSRTKFLVNKSVKHDATLSGSGTDADPLKVVAGTGSGIVESVVAGTGISVDSTDPANPIVTNTSPDQVVSITAGTNIDSVTGTYPNFTINASTQGGSYTLPTASDTVLGGIKVGDRLTITEGVLSADVQSGGGDFLADGTVPMTGDLNMGGNDITDVISVQADTSAGLSLKNASGTDCLLLGAGGGCNATFYDGVKLDTQTASTIAGFDANKNIVSLATATYPSLTELSYVKGVTSAIQTQLSNKQPLATVLTNTTASFTTALETKLNGIEALAEVNNISDVNATDLTDGGATTLHKHSYNNLDDKPTIPVNSDFNLGGLSDVNDTGKTTGKVLKYNTVSGDWEVGDDNNTTYTATDFDIKDLTDSTSLRSTWSGKQDALGFTPENVANKENTTLDTSTTKYPTNRLTKEYADGKVSQTITDGVTTSAPSQNVVYDALALKAPLTSPTFATSINGSYLTASQLLGTDASKNIVSLPVATYPSLTELSYVKGLSSAVQTQLNAKVLKSTFDAHSILYATTDNTPVALTVGEQTLVGRATGGNISAIAIDSDLTSVSATDNTIPSAKATKAALDLKAPISSPTFTGTVTLPTGSTTVAPIKMVAGTNLTTPVSGVFEYDGTNLFFTIA